MAKICSLRMILRIQNWGLQREVFTGNGCSDGEETNPLRAIRNLFTGTKFVPCEWSHEFKRSVHPRAGIFAGSGCMERGGEQNLLFASGLTICAPFFFFLFAGNKKIVNCTWDISLRPFPANIPPFIVSSNLNDCDARPAAYVMTIMKIYIRELFVTCLSLFSRGKNVKLICLSPLLDAKAETNRLMETSAIKGN